MTGNISSSLFGPVNRLKFSLTFVIIWSIGAVHVAVSWAILMFWMFWHSPKLSKVYDRSDFALFLAVFSSKFSRSTFFSRLFVKLFRSSSTMQHYKVLISTVSTTKRKKSSCVFANGISNKYVRWGSVNKYGKTQWDQMVSKVESIWHFQK